MHRGWPTYIWFCLNAGDGPDDLLRSLLTLCFYGSILFSYFKTDLFCLLELPHFNWLLSFYTDLECALRFVTNLSWKPILRENYIFTATFIPSLFFNRERKKRNVKGKKSPSVYRLWSIISVQEAKVIFSVDYDYFRPILASSSHFQ